MIKVNKYILLVLAVSLVITFSLTARTGSAEDKIIIKLGSFAPPGSFVHNVTEIFKTRVSEKTGGKAEVRIFPSEQLGSLSAQQEGMRVGTHQIAVIGSSIVALVPEFGIFDFPFLFDDRAQIGEIVNGPIGQKLLGLLEPKGLVGLCFLENGFNQMTNNVKPIVKPDDLKGLKMRVPKAPSRMLIYRTYGANPAPLPFNESFTALKQGVADGQDNPFVLIKDYKLFEVQKYLSKTYQYYSVLPLIASKMWWDKWPKEIQQALKEAAVEAADESRKIGKQIDDEALEFLKEKMQINEVDRQAFKDASGPIYDELSQSVGKDLFLEIQGALK